MAARPLHHPTISDPIHLLLAHADLGPLLAALAARTQALLVRPLSAECALILRRRNRPARVAGVSAPLTRLTEERLADDDVHLATALDRGAATAAPRLPHSWASGMAWGLDVGHLVVPVDAGPTARAALSFVGTVPTDLHERREALARIGRIRNEASWVLRLAVRFADEEERSQNRAQAMENRTVIDVAVGVIMAQSRCSADEAFDVLKRASNNRNIKLREVAAELVQRIHPSLPETVFSD